MQGNILVVEDDPDILRIILHTLKSAGYRVIPAYGGEDALRKVKRDQFDLILTDLSMPKMSGVELIETVKRDPSTAHIPIVAVTAYWMERMGDSAAEVGCDGYLTKPFRSADLLKAVTSFLANPELPKP